MSEEKSPEEIKHEQKRAFDAFNEAQASRSQTNRDARTIRDAAESRRWAKPEAGAADDGEVGENDSLGG
jgi:hypothetical protein